MKITATIIQNPKEATQEKKEKAIERINHLANERQRTPGSEQLTDNQVFRVRPSNKGEKKTIKKVKQGGTTTVLTPHTTVLFQFFR